MRRHHFALAILLLAGCSSGGGSSPPSTGGNSTAGSVASPTGGSSITQTGGRMASGGSSTSSTSGATGGTLTSGGATGTARSGGASASGGATSPAGGSSSGGATVGSGGRTGGATSSASGGGTSGGGITTNGGSTASGGVLASGGNGSTGGSPGTGGTTSTSSLDAAADVSRDTAAQGGQSGQGGNTGGTGGASTGVSSFHCVNWADQRDNFVDGTLLLSGILSSDSAAAVTTKATAVLTAFTDQLKANAVRMPINEPTVNGTYWTTYKAAIDVAVGKGMKVILGFWGKAQSVGRPADITAWYTMWQTVTTAYLSSPIVYFDIHNEPHGYTNTQWVQQVKDWMAKFPTVPANRIVAAGTGWDDNLSAVASAFPAATYPGMILEIHDYPFNNTSITTEAAWENDLTGRLSGNSSRTLVGEWGATMTGNVDFSAGTEGNNSKSFMVGMSNAINKGKMGSCYWPGLRTGDSWSMLAASGSTYTIVNQSALNLVWHSWGLN